MNGPATPITAAPAPAPAPMPMPRPLPGPSPLRHQLPLAPHPPAPPPPGGFMAQPPSLGPSLAPSRIDSGAHHTHNHQIQTQPGPPPLAAYGATTGPTPTATDNPDSLAGDIDIDADGEPDDQDMTSMSDYPHSAYNYGTWTAADDRTLLTARASGQHWADLQRTHFPTKTANACRKRYERLVERRGVYDYDARRLERISKEYMAMRKEIWSGLAARVGEKWNVVEAQCMSAGLRTIQSHARSHTNRWRRESKMSQKAARAPPEALHPITSGIGPVTTMGLISPVEDEFGAGLLPSQDEHAPIPIPPSRSSAEMMPPPFLPASSTTIPGAPQQPQVSFAGYLNGKSTRPSVSKGGMPTTVQPESQSMAPPPPPPPQPSMDPGWQQHGHGINTGYMQHPDHGWRDVSGLPGSGQYQPR